MSAAGLLVLAVVLATLATVLTRLRQLIGRAGNPAVRSLLLGCLALALALSVQLPVVYPVINQVGFNLAWPVQHVLVLGTAYLIQVFFLYSIEEPADAARRAARQALVLFAVTAVMLLLFAVTPRARDFLHGPAGRNEAGGPGDPVAALAFATFSLYLGWAALNLMRLAWQWSTKARDVWWLFVGLRLQVLAHVFTLAFCAHKLGFQLAVLFGVTPGWTADSVEGWLMPAACALATLGVTACALGETVARWVRRHCAPLVRLAGATAAWWRFLRAHHALYPLWARFAEVLPEITLDPPKSRRADLFDLRAGRRRLYRRLIELEDGGKQLRPAIPPEVQARVQELTGGRPPELVAAVRAAAGYAVALRRRELGIPDVTNNPLGSAAGAEDLAELVHRWRAITRAFRRDPVVRQVLAETTSTGAAAIAAPEEAGR
ncbi:MAB_1171c family putative transporter [Crossiella sp. CA198]|uniref:MAB_1171c family putative transporter n=1 Tax=Crossiella sp. CA198 TaxID=3455607 RepID=UPI003F8D6551